MGKVRKPCLAHAQQQLCQGSRRDDVVPAAFPCAAPAKPRLGRGIGVAPPEGVQRQDLLRDHRDRGQGHVQARHEADEVLLRRGGGLAMGAAGGRARGAARRGNGRGLGLDRLTRLVVQHEREVDGRDGDHVWWVEETDLRAVRVVDDEPVGLGVLEKKKTVPEGAGDGDITMLSATALLRARACPRRCPSIAGRCRSRRRLPPLRCRARGPSLSRTE